jgi:hypothetical protein
MFLGYPLSIGVVLPIVAVFSLVSYGAITEEVLVNKHIKGRFST